LYTFLETESYLYAIRLKSNAVLERHIQHLLTRPAGRPPKKPVVRYHSFMYQAGSWDCERRVVAKVEWYQGELFPRVGFIVTNLSWRNKRVVRFYNQRGTAEQWIKEGKNAVKWTKLSCHDFVDNQVRLQLFALAYNLGNFLRRLAFAQAHEALDHDNVAGQADQDRCEGDSSFAIRVLPDGRGSGAPQVVRRHPGTHPTIANRGQHGSVVTPRHVAKAGTRRRQTGISSAPRREHRAWLGTDQPLGGPQRALKSAAPREKVRKVVGATGARCILTGHRPAA